MTQTGRTRTASRFDRHFTVDRSAAALATHRVTIYVALRAWRHKRTQYTAVVVTSPAIPTLRRKRVNLWPRSLSTHGGHFADSTTLPARRRRPHTTNIIIIVIIIDVDSGNSGQVQAKSRILYSRHGISILQYSIVSKARRNFQYSIVARIFYISMDLG